MKANILLFLVGFFMLGLTVNAQQNLTDRSKGVLIMSADTDPLPHAFAREKSCEGLHQVQWFGNSTDSSDWSLAVVNNGRGIYEVTLFAVAKEPHHYVYLGTNTKKAVRKACNIVSGRENAVWMVVQ
jgi:hypothetical protein